MVYRHVLLNDRCKKAPFSDYPYDARMIYMACNDTRIWKGNEMKQNLARKTELSPQEREELTKKEDRIQLIGIAFSVVASAAGWLLTRSMEKKVIDEYALEPETDNE